MTILFYLASPPARYLHKASTCFTQREEKEKGATFAVHGSCQRDQRGVGSADSVSLTVETERNGDLWSTNDGGPSGWFVGLVVPVQELFFLPCLLWSAQYKIIFSSPQFMCPRRSATWAVGCSDFDFFSHFEV